jgi:hypothetical protein
MEAEPAHEENLGQEPQKKIKTDTNELEQLRKHSLVVADTGDFNLIEKYLP